MNPGDTADTIALIGESMMEWFYPGKITAIGIEKAKSGGTKTIARIVDTAHKDIPGIRKALEGDRADAAHGKRVSVSELALSIRSMPGWRWQICRSSPPRSACKGWEAQAPDLQPQEMEPLAPEEESPSKRSRRKMLRVR